MIEGESVAMFLIVNGQVRGPANLDPQETEVYKGNSFVIIFVSSLRNKHKV